jgi:hypothetical protein
MDMFTEGSARMKALSIIKFIVAHVFVGMAYLLMRLSTMSCSAAEWITGTRISEKSPEQSEQSDLPWWP